MGGSVRIARIAGIDIKLHFTFGLIILFGALQFASAGVRGYLFGALLMVLVFVSVTLHELGHSLVARAYGIAVKDITLTPLGGIAQLNARAKKPIHELLISIAGPAVNVVLGFGLLGLALLQYTPEQLFGAWSSRQPSLPALWAMLISANFVLAAFNLLPALPMDGGRVFRAFLALFMGMDRATRWAAVVGRLFAIGFVVLGLFGGSPLLALIGVFVFLAAGAEERSVRMDQVLEGVRARDAVNPYAPRFAPNTTVGEAMHAMVYTPTTAFAVEHFGRLLGVVTREALNRGLRERGPHAYVAGVMDRTVPVISANEPVDAARTKMNEAVSPYVAVVDHDVLLGLITELELAQAAMLQQSMRPPRVSRPPVHRPVP